MTLDRHRPRQEHALMQELAVVRKMIGHLEAKLLKHDTDHFLREDDQELRLALQRIGDDRLTRLTLDYAVCVRGLTAPMVSRTWKQELMEDAEETHRLLLNRLLRVDRLARSPVGRLWMRLQARLHRVFRYCSNLQRLPLSMPKASREGGNRIRFL